jgi:hypothetical protein
VIATCGDSDQEQEQKAMRNGNPYSRYEKDEIWRVLEKGIKALVKNGDLEEKTARAHIVGYLTQALREAGIGRQLDSSKVKVIKVSRNEEVLLRRVS